MKKMITGYWKKRTLYFCLLAGSGVLTTFIKPSEEITSETDARFIKKISQELCTILRDIETLNKDFLNPNDNRSLKNFFYGTSLSQLEQLHTIIEGIKQELKQHTTSSYYAQIEHLIKKLEDFYHDARLKIEQMHPFMTKSCNLSMFTQLQKIFLNAQGTRSSFSPEDIELLQGLAAIDPAFEEALGYIMNIKNIILNFEKKSIAAKISLLKKRFA